jgi:type IV pilus assembly protein PilB
MTARDMIKALDSVADGADAQQVFGVKAPVETIVSSLLSVLLRKGLIADWEFVEEVRKRRK